MSTFTLATNLRKKIKNYLLNNTGTDSPESRQSLARDAGFPDELFHNVNWTQQPLAEFVDSLIENLVKWGTFSEEDKRYALIEYLKAARNQGGGENRMLLEEILEEFVPLISGQTNVESSSKVSKNKTDWGEALDIEGFYGRTKEQATLERWIIKDRCRLVGIFGMGGIGKSTLVNKFTREIEQKFDYVIWRSLTNAPPLNDILTQCIQFLSDQKEIEPGDDLQKQIHKFVDYLRSHRCLVIFDNVETILSGDQAGTFLKGYESYGQLIKNVGFEKHQSCLLLTGREKPHEIGLMERTAGPVRSLELGGIEPKAGRQLLKGKMLSGSDEAQIHLIDLYSGNPLALNIVAEMIRQIYLGKIDSFLNDGAPVFGRIENIIEEQFKRLSDLEKDIMRWLAIEREAVTRDELIKILISREDVRDLNLALQTLRLRSLIEQSSTGFALQNVIMEYMTDQMVIQFSEEIISGKLDIIKSHALIKAQTREYVRESQARLILGPTAEALLNKFGLFEVEEKLGKILDTLRTEEITTQGYVAGNILNLLIHLKSDLSKFNFSHLNIRQANFQGALIHKTNFTNANIEKSAFTAAFDRIISVAYNPNGKTIAGGTANGDIHIWRAEDGQSLCVCQGHRDLVWSISFSPDGSIIASGSIDQTIRLWNAITGQPIKILEGHKNQVRSVAFSPDGHMLASGSGDRTICLWDIGTGKLVKTLIGNIGWVLAVAFSPDGTKLASGSQEGELLLWEIETGQQLLSLKGCKAPIRSLAFSPKGNELVNGSDDQTIRIWDLGKGYCVKELKDYVWAVAFSPNGNLLASSGIHNQARIWDLNSNKILKSLPGHTDWVRSLAFSPDGSFLLSGSDDQTIRLWDINRGQCLRILQGYNYLAYAVTFAHNSKILASGEESASIRLWDAETGTHYKTLQGVANRFRSVAFSPDDTLLAGSSENETIELWDIVKGKYLPLRGHTNQVFSVAFNHSGDTLASGSTDKTIRLWNVQTGENFKTLTGHTDRIRAVAFSPDDNFLVSSGFDKSIWVWDLKTGEVTTKLQGHTDTVWSIAFSADGQYLFTGSDDKTVCVWNMETCECTEKLIGHMDGVLSIAISPNGNWLASGSKDQTIRIWKYSGFAWQCIRIFKEHTRPVRSVAFSYDNSILASSSDDETIRVWDFQAGKCINKLIPERPYEGMNITGVTGLTEAQKITLKTLGAIEL